MSAIRDEFGPDEVTAVAINWKQQREIVQKFITDTGLRAPVLIDLGQGLDPVCFQLPSGPEPTVTEHFRNRVFTPGFNAPFPLQVIVDTEGRLAFASRRHSTEEVTTVLRELVRAQASE
ncbi:MAG: hypothetical protein CME06_13925 [Gemmatimonadetes bacterium]|nr:hypothetical protein [Gemmatimonadota bacterium]